MSFLYFHILNTTTPQHHNISLRTAVKKALDTHPESAITDNSNTRNRRSTHRGIITMADVPRRGRNRPDSRQMWDESDRRRPGARDRRDDRDAFREDGARDKDRRNRSRSRSPARRDRRDRHRSRSRDRRDRDRDRDRDRERDRDYDRQRPRRDDRQRDRDGKPRRDEDDARDGFNPRQREPEDAKAKGRPARGIISPEHDAEATEIRMKTK